jgi:heparin binding hemagglutinin HbhA
VIDMAKAKFDIKDIKTEAQRGLHATVGAADLALEAVKDVVADAQKQLAKAQKQVKGFEFQPKALRSQATTVVTSTVDELSKDAKARRDVVEKRVAALQAEAQKVVTGNVENVVGTYDELVKRGETVVRKFRNQPAARQTVTNAKTTVSKAKTTATQAKKSPAKKSAKATGTAAKKTVKSAAKTVS